MVKPSYKLEGDLNARPKILHGHFQLIVGAVKSNSKQTSSYYRYSGAARWRACLLSITCYYITWASCKCSIFGQTQCRWVILSLGS